MTLQQINYFLEIARTQHFTKAAANLFISQSSLSHSIQQLERELEVPLFIRKSGKKVTLTEYAKAFLPYCERVQQEIAGAESAIRRMRNPISGTVTVAYSYVNGASLVPELFNQFYLDNDYEDITVQFEVNHERVRIEDNLLKGEIDLAITCTQNIDGLEILPVAKQKLIVMLPAGHPLAGRESVTVEDIKDEPVICYYHGWNLSNRVEEIYKNSGYKPNFSMYTTDWSSQMAMVSLGLGIAICPRLPVDPKLISIVSLDDPLKWRNVNLLWARNRKLSPAVEYVRQYCVDYFRNREARMLTPHKEEI